MEIEIIKDKIYQIRGQRIMLDFDLAELYETETRILKQAVRRNIERFPEDFMFQLSKTELNELITNCDNLPKTLKFSPSTPFAFTEQGVAMLSSVINSKKAIAVNITIIRAFVMMRQYLSDVKEIQNLKEIFYFASPITAENGRSDLSQGQVNGNSNLRVGNIFLMERTNFRY